ncbi:MAG: hypothetical protein KDC92_15445, partial [Bacteroidetes bacterium]|nr:hypothetical protein [Bacteroidota bacterium]
MKFNINHQLGKWQQVANGYVAGKAFFKNEMLEGEKLSQYFNHEKPIDLAQKLKALSGQFAVVLDFEKWGFAAVDNVRSIPLFYNQTEQFITNYLDANQCDLSDESIKNGHFERIEYLFGKLT